MCQNNHINSKSKPSFAFRKIESMQLPGMRLKGFGFAKNKI